MKKTGVLKAMKLCRDYEKMSPERQKEIREERLRSLVQHARTCSPFYRNLYRNVPKDFRLEDLPPVNKRTLMEHWDEWITDRDLTLEDTEKFMKNKDNIGRKLNGKYLVFTTSGSTGNPLVCICDPTADSIMGGISAVRSFARKEDLAAFMRKGGKTIGVFADDGFYLGNTSIRSRLLKMPWKRKQLAVSSALLPIPAIVSRLNAFQPAMLGGYPSNLELLIREAEEGRLSISPVLIMTGGEYLSDTLRQKLSDTFHCYVQTSYSCTEAGTAACECRSRHFYINDDWLIIEPADREGNPVGDGIQSDHILLTNLYNYTQPFIRYEVSDRIIMHHEPCPCGKASPWIEPEGRTDDVTEFTDNGKTIRIAPLSVYAVLKQVHELRRFQAVVSSGNTVEMRIEEFPSCDRQEAFEKGRERLMDYLASQGIHHVSVTLSDQLPCPDPGSGKFRHIINRQKRPDTIK